MTQTTDATAEVQRVALWLAEQPCPGRDADTACTFTLFCICQGIGLAFPWASEECQGRRPSAYIGVSGGGIYNMGPIDLDELPPEVRPKVEKKCRLTNRPIPGMNRTKKWYAACEGKCNGSGRVPKAVGLEELLIERGVSYLSFEEGGGKTWWEAWKGRATGKAETPLLAALRAIATSAGMP